MIGKPFLRLSLTTSSEAGLSGDLALLFELLWRNLENDSLIILGIKLDDGETLDKGVPAVEWNTKLEGLIVLGSDLMPGL